MEVQRVGIVGCGLMGRGIAEICSRAGIPVTVREINQELLDKGLGAVRVSLAKSLEKRRIDAEEHDRAISNLSGTVDLADLAGSDLIVEAIVEDLETKRELFVSLDDIVGEDTIFASNTSSLTLTQFAASTSRPDRFVGLHFFNPVPGDAAGSRSSARLMTSDEAYDACWGSGQAGRQDAGRVQRTTPVSSSTGCWSRICWMRSAPTRTASAAWKTSTPR